MMINWSLFLQSDVQSVVTCSACMRPPGQAVFGLLSAVWAWTPEEGAAFNPSWTREGGAWIFPSSVPHKGGWLYFTWRLSVDVGVLKSPCYPFPRFWAGPVHGDEDPCTVMKTWWTSAGSCRWQIALQVAREYHSCPSVRAMPPMKTNFNLIVTIFLNIMKHYTKRLQWQQYKSAQRLMRKPYRPFMCTFPLTGLHSVTSFLIPFHCRGFTCLDIKSIWLL